MSTLKKVLLSVAAVFLVIVATTVGVFAIQTSTLEVTNTLSFTGTSIAATVVVSAATIDSNDNIDHKFTSAITSQSDFTYNSTAKTYTLTFDTSDTDPTTTKSISYAEASNIEFTKGQQVQFSINIKNTGVTPFFVNITNTAAASDYSAMNISYYYTSDNVTEPEECTTSTFPFRNNQTAVEYNSTITILIRVTAKNTGRNCSGNFSWQINLVNYVS